MFQIGSVFPNCRRDATDSRSSRRSLVQTFLEVGHRRLLHPLLCATAYPLRIGTAGGRSDESSYSTLAEPRNNPDAMSPSIRSAGTILSNRISVHALCRGAAQRNRCSSPARSASSQIAHFAAGAKAMRGHYVALVNLPSALGRSLFSTEP